VTGIFNHFTFNTVREQSLCINSLDSLRYNLQQRGVELPEY